MANRISRVTTRTGDTGTSGTATGRRLPKTDALFAALGDVDELNSHLGLIRAALSGPGAFPDFADNIQQSLFDLGACLATEAATPAPDASVLEHVTAELNAALPPLKEFVLPGGGEAGARCHVARAVCRRAERSVWALGDGYTACAVYLNRLSDLLFVWARTLARADGSEVVWRGTARQTST